MDNQVHWVNNFWGQDDAGYRQLMNRIHSGKQTCDELKQFYRERLAIEQEYAKKLTALSRRALGSNETGGMKQSLETVRSTTKAAAASHETVARQLSEQLIAPLEAFSTSMRGRTKTVEETMGQLSKAKSSQNHSSEKAKSRYVAECNKISGYQAQQNLLMGKELDRNNQKLDRATYQVEGLQRQYQDSLRVLAQTMENWNSEWRVSCDKIEQVEDERLTFLKSNLWAYANSLSAACVADDESCETVRLSLERCDPARDIENYSREFGTGSRIQDPPEFVNFLQGFSRDAEGDDGHYHVANFGSSLATTEVPDLAPSTHSSHGSAAVSPVSNNCQFTPMSSPGESPVISQEVCHEKPHDIQQQQHQQQQQYQSLKHFQPQQTDVKDTAKKRRSWAMPFKRKSNPDLSNLKYISALDQPSTASVTPSQYGQSQFQPQSKPQVSQTNTDLRRQSWAPPSGYTPAETSRNSVSNGTHEDPLLTALERLKTPDFKPRPKSMGYPPVANNVAPPSPYDNGSSPVAISPSSPTQVRRKPIYRKQVGSEGDSSLPSVTSEGRPVIKHSRAQYDYRAAIPEEVTFRKGDLLLITEMQEDGWWDCEVAGKGVFGLAPSNFLTDVK